MSKDSQKTIRTKNDEKLEESQTVAATAVLTAPPYNAASTIVASGRILDWSRHRERN